MLSLGEAVNQTLEALGLRSRAYYVVFRSLDGAEVLKDLAKFCRANETTSHETPTGMATLEGRRQVFLRIIEHLQKTPTELYEIYGGKYPIMRELPEENEE